MELRHLRYFAAVAEEGHVHRAATRLRLAQPALTQQIKALERELGVQLIIRAGRGIALTDVGIAFHVEAKAILAQVERAVARARDIEAGRAGLVRVGFTESASFHPAMTHVLKRFRAQRPDVECRLEESHTEALVKALEEGSLDVAFVRPPVRSSGAITFRIVTDEPMVVAVPIGHPLARHESLPLTMLEGEPFVTYPRRTGAGLSEAVMAECRHAGFIPKVVQQTPQLSSTINIVAAGMGIAIVPMCMRHQRPESVRFVSLSMPRLKAEIGFAIRRNGPNRIGEHLLALVGEMFPEVAISRSGTKQNWIFVG